jgi:hypothetical protein
MSLEVCVSDMHGSVNVSGGELVKLKRRITSLLATATLLGGSFVGLSATNASAADPCDTTIINVNNSSGSGHLRWDAAIRPKPYEACGSKGTFVEGTKIYYWCYVYNDYGNLWILGRVAGTETRGWIYAPNVYPVSDVNPCY